MLYDADGEPLVESFYDDGVLYISHDGENFVGEAYLGPKFILDKKGASKHTRLLAPPENIIQDLEGRLKFMRRKLKVLNRKIRKASRKN